MNHEALAKLYRMQEDRPNGLPSQKMNAEKATSCLLFVCIFFFRLELSFSLLFVFLLLPFRLELFFASFFLCYSETPDE